MRIAALVLGVVLLIGLWSFPALRDAARPSADIATMPDGCDPTTERCEVRFGDGVRATLRVTTATTADGEHRLRWTVDGDWTPDTASFSGVSMNMGFYTAEARREGAGYLVSINLPACHNPVMRWQADLEGEDRIARFEFDVARTRD